MICAIAFAIGQLRLASIPEFFVWPHFHELREYIFSSMEKMVLIYENLQHASSIAPHDVRATIQSKALCLWLSWTLTTRYTVALKGQRCANGLDGTHNMLGITPSNANAPRTWGAASNDLVSLCF